MHDMPFGIMDIVGLLHLKIRRSTPRGAYVDCPICGDQRGKLFVSSHEDVWRCNYCGANGGMLKLYGLVRNVTNARAYHEICDALINGMDLLEQPNRQAQEKCVSQQSTLADIQTIHKTLSALFDMLSLSKHHREHLSVQRGLSDEQIDRFGFKSVPPFYLCRPLVKRLLDKGHVVQGVPGFYVDKDGQWTIQFPSLFAGFLIPVRGVDGLIHGAQIRLDVPLKNKDDPPEKTGAKYVWLSSSGKPMGVSSGSPLHFIGAPARTVYITEGCLKADIAHCMMNRTFAAIAGVNNTKQLDLLFAYLKEQGTEEIIEAEDIDKYRNPQVHAGAQKIHELAAKHQLKCRSLFWNPNYKGIDDWQLALRRQKQKKEEILSFRERFIRGLCDFEAIEDEQEFWKETAEQSCKFWEHLGFTAEEYSYFVKNGKEKMKHMLLSQQVCQRYRIYQLNISQGIYPFAFAGIKELKKAGYKQPPAAGYRLVHDGELFCDKKADDSKRLEAIAERYRFDLPDGYAGRQVAPSDVVELYDDGTRRYYYRDKTGFCQVDFSPFLVKPLDQKSKGKRSV